MTRPASMVEMERIHVKLHPGTREDILKLQTDMKCDSQSEVIQRAIDLTRVVVQRVKEGNRIKTYNQEYQTWEDLIILL